MGSGRKEKGGGDVNLAFCAEEPHSGGGSGPVRWPEVKGGQKDSNCQGVILGEKITGRATRSCPLPQSKGRGGGFGWHRPCYLPSG